jgi:ribonuclease R
VETYAQKIDTSITETEIANRRDMRDTLQLIQRCKVLMMPYHLKKLENGNYEFILLTFLII